MARAASRPRTTKAKSAPTPAKPEPAPGGVKAFTKRLTAVRIRTSKKPAKQAKPAAPAAARSKKRAPKGSPAGPRPLPLYLRVPAMAVGFAVLVGFGAILARLTLEPSPASVPLIHTNLRPGHSLKAYLDQPALRDAVRQIGGNILLGVPFGILVPVVAPKARGILKVLLLTALVMLAVEFAQGALVTGRAFDIDDVILNTTGALIGYLLLGRRLGRGVHARRG
ncbi:VanZ family protein [Streptomyces niveiscabiei]|uniref:VanZ family protein n=1 Tax=Streptomyces niveiscabiei TaxID=164115 RepID=UPI0026BC4FFB